MFKTAARILFLRILPRRLIPFVTVIEPPPMRPASWSLYVPAGKAVFSPVML